MTNHHPAALTPEQMAHNLRDRHVRCDDAEGYGLCLVCEEEGQCRALKDIAASIRSAVMAERERCALIADDMASVCAYSRDLNPTIWDRCRNVSLDIADAIRATETDNG